MHKDVLKQNVKSFFDFTKEKHMTTYAGGLAYFLFSGYSGFLGVTFFILKQFGASEEIINELVAFFYFGGIESENIKYEIIKKASTIGLLVFGIYSGAHLYFHLIRAGENIYGVIRGENKLNRIFSFIYLFLVQLVLLFALFIDVFGVKIASLLGFKNFVKEIIAFSSGLILNILLVFLLQIFASPLGKKNIYCVKNGATLTIIYWEIARLIFSLYRNFFIREGNGLSLSSVCVFLLYVYFMMRGLLYGIALNAFKIKGIKNVSI